MTILNLTLERTGDRVSVVAENVLWYQLGRPTGTIITFDTTDSGWFKVTESMDEILALLQIK